MQSTQYTQRTERTQEDTMEGVSGSFAAGYAAAERFWKGKAAKAAKALLAEPIDDRKVTESLQGAGAESAMKEAIALRDQDAGWPRARGMGRFNESGSK